MITSQRSSLRGPWWRGIGSPRARPIADSAAVFLLTCALIFPLFGLEYLDNWGSIESTFIADARILRENLPHPGWYPLWYCGTRFDYIYPPALRYGTALISLAFNVSTARGYHLYTALLYALGIAGVYWLSYAGSRSRLQAWLAAVFTALLSPSLAFMPDLLRDSPLRVPQRLHVLVSYGEGPHISAISVLGFALAASVVALRRWNPAIFAAAGVLCAGVVANNFYGAVALAILFPILTWSIWLDVKEGAVWLRAAGIALTAYGLSAFWLTPSYIRVTNMNLRWVASARTPGSRAVVIACVVVFCVVTYLISWRLKNIAWPVFLAGAAAFLSLYVLGQYFYKFTVSGNGLRLAPEFDLAVCLVGAFLAATAWKRTILRSGIVVLLCLIGYPGTVYLRHAWTIFPQAKNIGQRPEFSIPQWMALHMPGARALPAGSIRFWYDAWNDNAQAYGGSDQGMLNQIIIVAHWAIVHGSDARLAVAWLQALGVDAAIVPGKTSKEIYHDYEQPEKFHDILTAVLHDDGQGNVVYRVPRRWTTLARVVDRGDLVSSGRLRGDEDLPTLMRYVSAVEHGPDTAVTVTRANPDTADITVSAAPGQALLFQETLDPAWHAYVDGKPGRIERDPVGFMLVDTPPGTHRIQLRFETPIENRLGWALTGVTCVFLAWIVVVPPHRRRHPS